VGVCGKFVERDRILLERMVTREPFAPMSLMEMYSEYINGVTVSSEEPPSDTYSPKDPLTSPPYISCICPFYISLPHISLPYFSNLHGSVSPVIKLPSPLPWCRQCDPNCHINYSTIPCSRCKAPHQTSACAMTIMGMCIYCGAIGTYFSQLCPQRTPSLFCGKCGHSSHDTQHCLVIPRSQLPRPRNVSCRCCCCDGC
jgi:hypothetical protein